MPFTLYGSDRYAAQHPPERRLEAAPAQPVSPPRPLSDQEGSPQQGRPRPDGGGVEGPPSALAAYAETARPRARQPALHAHQIMSSPVTTLTPETSILEAWRLFRAKRYRHIPVVDSEGRLVGIVADRDLLRYAAVNGRIPPFDEHSVEAQTAIATLMKPRVLTATPDTEIRQIARVLIEQHIGAMPIMDYQGRLRGIVTRSDILRALVTHAPLELWV